MNEETDRMNRHMLEHLAFFLNSRPEDVSRDTLKTLTEQTGLTEEEAYPYLLAAGMELDVQRLTAGCSPCTFRRWFTAWMRRNTGRIRIIRMSVCRQKAKAAGS